ncbi:MAG: hypothetical protein R3Y36_08790 [Spirochaetales bacterium]
MTNLQKAISFAKKDNYDSAEYSCEWEGYEVYSPFFDDDELRMIGYPQQILIKEDEIRYSSPDESFQILPFLPED